VHDAGHCHVRLDLLDHRDPEDRLDHHDLDHRDHQSHDLHLDHRGVVPCRDDPLLDHRGDLHLDSSDATDRRCRPDHGRVRSAECDRCAHQFLRDADHRDHDPSADADLHRDVGSHQVVAESDDHSPAVAGSDDHSAQDAAVGHPVVVAVQLLAESGVVLAPVLTEQMVRCARNHP
jgi:hypothetical protein